MMCMMINKRLIGIVGGSKKYIGFNVVFQWLGLASNICLILSVTNLLGRLAQREFDATLLLITLAVALVSLAIRILCSVQAAKMSYKASEKVKKTLREQIYQKLLRLGISYNDQVPTSEAVQVSVEGVEQLEIYFGKYLPQFFYSMLAPITLFAVLSFINFKSAVLLLICVPLIPVSIVAVQKFAKKLLAKYWGEYTALGDHFLENVQGLTTLKIYQADEHKNQEMNRQAERFRKITMKVLTMQLNSVTLMDLIAFGGAALGVIVSVSEFRAGNVDFAGCLAIILLAADFFIPLRLLGSFFHIAMNGMAASDKMFRILDLPEKAPKTQRLSAAFSDIRCTDLRYSYEPEREILHGVDLVFPRGSFTSIVGKSGCGKSTIAALLMGINQGYSGSITVGGKELSSLTEESIMQQITLIGHNSYLFQGSVRENLRMGRPNASDQSMWAALDQVNLADFLEGEDGLDTRLEEGAANLSGGQRQRLALARALLHDSSVYIFDEATSNIDVESENDIMKLVAELAQTKTVILISHRLANVVHSDTIYVLEEGCVVESGTHRQLLNRNGTYADLWESQQALEQVTREEVAV
jgi:ABC-type transport system involved in cytochrome bd biosynthesis fused ATPase/permease subunit